MRTSERRGAALATTLLISVILLILALSFLAFLERDYRFAGHQEKSQQAFYLAQAGLEFFKSRPDLVPAGGLPLKKSVPAGDSQHYFQVQLANDGTLKSQGVVCTPLGTIIADRTLVVPPQRSTREYQDESR